MVEIIKGTFGYFDGRRVVPVTIKDGPQNWDPDLERRLVARGIAKYVEDEKPAEKTEKPVSEMSYRELQKLAKDKGLNAKLKKAELLSALDEEPPVFNASDSVV